MLQFPNGATHIDERVSPGMCCRSKRPFETLEAQRQFEFRDIMIVDDRSNYLNMNPNSSRIGAEKKVFAQPVSATGCSWCFRAFAGGSRWTNVYQTASFGSTDINQEAFQPIPAELQEEARFKPRPCIVTRFKMRQHTCEFGRGVDPRLVVNVRLYPHDRGGTSPTSCCWV
jgi:hypothetical protein